MAWDILNVVPRAAHEFLSRPRRRHGRCRRRQGWTRCPDPLGHPQDRGCSSCSHRSSASPLGSTLMIGILWPGAPPSKRRSAQPGLPPRPARLRRGVQPRHTAATTRRRRWASSSLVLIAAGHSPTDAEVPLWVVLSAHRRSRLGTLAGGWRIVKTMGPKIAKLQPVGGLVRRDRRPRPRLRHVGAGIPVSTTHTITGAIVGVAPARRLSAVSWEVAGRVVWAWVLTIPARS